ncbi:unnamed protein product [Parascedosporium putredinis]|uniref:Amidohydrolase-related domain-containing protein n=1 Tax=Parascedosporium putredinis TaxID=1442378 RepID=A0A9P1H296_9PEZI|nr:unnamed protein product [Parascedosporium putredinis]CAI7993430.1 unnamed protein product [Parascedosporium putredinis]
MVRGTIAIEEAVINPSDLEWLGDSAAMYAPGSGASDPSANKYHALSQRLADIHDHRLKQMDAEGVEYMLLSVTSPGPQGEGDPVEAQRLAVHANDWLAAECARNPSRFGGLASLSMHDGEEAARELRRAVKELGMFGAILNDYQTVGADADEVVIVSIPFNLWRADHWYNKPVKKATRPSKEDYSHYFKKNISLTTSGNFNTRGLKFCIEEVGLDRCLYSIDYPYDEIKEAQDWWKGVDLPADQKEVVARTNAIKLFKLPLEI